jgi:RNA polymerase sigma factor (sigma-70 family)
VSADPASGIHGDISACCPDVAGFSDAELLRRSGREPELFGELYRRHAAAVYRRLMRDVGDEQVAADLTAETFAQAWLHRARFRDEAGGAALPWLQGIATNLLRDYWKHRRLDQQALRRLGLPRSLSSDPALELIDERDAGAALRCRVRAGVGRLPVSQQEAIRLRVLEGLTFDEIGRRLGCSATLARVRAWRGLRALRAGLGGEEGE